MRLLTITLLLTLDWAFADPLFLEKHGVVAIEAESTSSRLRDWIKKTDVPDFMGECHLEFTGNRPESGPPESPLEYQFQVKKGGLYQLTLRARKRLETTRKDISNDCYVSVKGNFEAGGEASLDILKKPTKIYGGNADSWGWATNLDVHHKKYPALYLFQPDETYTLTIHGRSQNFNLDRILFVHEDVGLREARDKNPKENKSEDPITGPSKFTPLTERTLTNRDGRTVHAKLISKTPTTVTVIINGRRHTIPLDTLSHDDQQFIKQWTP